ncbi:hypothetical protein KA005_47270 [bacterium]|nr:hypothetical protein [bacterium]
MKLEQGRTVGNNVMVELDPENDHIKMKDGGQLYVDTTFEPEKHVTVTGTVKAIPSHLRFNPNDPNMMPWETDMELQIGDRVIMHYLAVVNCFRKEIKKYWAEKGRRFVFIQYRSVYCMIRNGDIIPINGYCLVEPIPDRYIQSLHERADTAGLILAGMNEKNNKRVVYGKVAYTGKPNKRYFDTIYTDNEVNISPGDEVVMRKISDIPAEYEYHAKMDGGRKLYRVQRRDIFGIV